MLYLSWAAGKSFQECLYIKGNLGCVFKFSIEDELAFLLKSSIKLQNHKKKTNLK